MMRLSMPLLALLAGLSCAARAATPIELMVEDDAAPWSRRDGTGFANDLVKASYAAVHAEVSLTVVPYARCKQYALAGQVAGCFNMSDAPELHGAVVFADAPLFQGHPRFYTYRAHALHAASMRELARGARIGIVNGYEYPAAVAQLAERGVVLEVAGSEAANLKKLAAGRLDAVILMTDQLKTEAALLHQAGVDRLDFLFAIEPMGSYIGFSLRHRDGARARSLFNEGYRLITANGARRAIERKWAARQP